MLIYTRTKSRAYMKAPRAGPMEGTPLLRLFLPRLGFTRYVMQSSHLMNNYGSRAVALVKGEGR